MRARGAGPRASPARSRRGSGRLSGRRPPGALRLAAGLALLAACARDAGQECLPQTTATCAGTDSCPGVRVCEPTGSFGPCRCDDPRDAPDAGGAARDPSPVETLSGATPEGEPRPGVVGRRCLADADCENGLRCARSDGATLSGGGPQGGLCTALCESDAECQRFDPIAGCTLAGIDASGRPARYCAPLCITRQPQPGQIKCAGRSDLACLSDAASAAPEAGRCVPVCQDDAACGRRHCDLSTGACRDRLPEGRPLGADCERDDECQSGSCRGFEGEPRFCSGLCTLGSLAGCGFVDRGAPRQAACLDPFVATEGVGDLGVCSQLCDADADCAHPAFSCRALDASVAELLGRGGVCAGD